MHALPDVWRPFNPVFIKRVKSFYREEWSFRTVNTQMDALALSGDNDLRQEVSPMQSVGLTPNNPLHEPDMFLAGIESVTNRMSPI